MAVCLLKFKGHLTHLEYGLMSGEGLMKGLLINMRTAKLFRIYVDLFL